MRIPSPDEFLYRFSTGSYCEIMKIKRIQQKLVAVKQNNQLTTLYTENPDFVPIATQEASALKL